MKWDNAAVISATALLVSILVAGANASAQVIVADSAAEFSGVQGQDGWRYGYYSTPGAYETFTELPYHPGVYGSWSSTPLVWGVGGHPKKLAGERWSVRRWESSVAGSITIQGTLAKIDVGGGDGVEGQILVDGVPIYSHQIGGTDGAGVQFSISATVGSGGAVDVAIAPLADESYDSTLTVVTISLSPTSSDFDGADFPIGGPNATVGWNHGACFATSCLDLACADGLDFLEPNDYGGATGCVLHPGEDWNLGSYDDDCGQQVTAMANGEIVATPDECAWGTMVIRHDNVPVYGTVWSVYGHLDDAVNTFKSKGMVARGEPIARVFKTGDVPYCHLHFEIRTSDLGNCDFPNEGEGGGDPAVINATYLKPTSFVEAHRPVANVPSGPQDISMLGSASVAGGLKVSLDEPVSGVLGANFRQTAIGDAAQEVQDPASVNFGLPSDPVQSWDISFEHAITTPAILTLGYDDTSLGSSVSEAALAVYHFVQLFAGCTQYLDCGWLRLDVLERNTQANTIVVEADSFSQFMLGGEIAPASSWTFSGTAAGGTIKFTVGAVALEVITFAGEGATDVAEAIAAAINTNSTLSGAGVTASVVGQTVTTGGSITTAVVDDGGLDHALGVATMVPSLSPISSLLVAALVLAVGAARWRRVSSPGPGASLARRAARRSPDAPASPKTPTRSGP